MLAVALLPVVAAPVAGEPGTTHAAWHVAAVALQVIMQVVVAELCATRNDLLLFATADPTLIVPANDSRTQAASAARTLSSTIQVRKATITRSRPPRKTAWLRITMSRVQPFCLSSYAVKM